MSTAQDNTTYGGEVEVFLCPNCGSAMNWDAAAQKFRCPSCATETDDAEGDGIVSELPFTPEMIAHAKTDWGAGRVIVRCESCGAEISVDEHATSVECTYCGSPHVLTTRQEAGIAPEGVVPFVVDENGAKQIFTNWVGKRFWAPRALKRLYQQLKMKDVYEPYWTYDAQTQSSWHARGGEAYYVTVGSGKNKRRERRIRWHSIRGTWQRAFDDVLVSGNRTHSHLLGRIDDYDTKAAKPYAPAYLSGVGAQHYTVLPDEGFATAKQTMQGVIEQEITASILRRYDEVSGLSTTTSYSNVHFKHLLVPIWTTAFMYKNKQYGCMINGQTGKITGEYPKSGAKIAAAVVLGLAALIGLIWLLGYSGIL